MCAIDSASPALGVDASAGVADMFATDGCSSALDPLTPAEQINIVVPIRDELHSKWRAMAPAAHGSHDLRHSRDCPVIH